jgi:hypothetical protein
MNPAAIDVIDVIAIWRWWRWSSRSSKQIAPGGAIFRFGTRRRG